MGSKILLDEVSTPGPGEVTDCASIGRNLMPGARLFQATVTGGAPIVALEGSTDRAEWITIKNDITASCAFSFSEPWVYVRGNYLSGTGTVTLAMSW